MKKDTAHATCLVITIGFIVVFLIFKQDWAIYTALTIGTAGTLSKFIANKIEWFWFIISQVVSKIFPTILLTLIFYLFLFPISLFSRLFTKDPLLLKNGQKSTFKDVIKIDIKKSMEKTW